MTEISGVIFAMAIIATVVKLFLTIVNISSSSKKKAARLNNANSYGCGQNVYHSNKKQFCLNNQQLQQHMDMAEQAHNAFNQEMFDLQNQQFMQESLNNVTSIENGGTNFGIDMSMHDGLAGGFDSFSGLGGGFDSFGGGFGMF